MKMPSGHAAGANVSRKLRCADQKQTLKIVPEKLNLFLEDTDAPEA
jgi:hypothetical protein